MAANRRSTLNFPTEIKAAPWKPGDEVEGSLVLSTPSFPSERSCKLEPSTIRGVALEEERRISPRRASEPLISPTTRDNINKWFIGQENANFHCNHMSDAKACGVSSTRPDVVPVTPLHGTNFDGQCIQNQTIGQQPESSDNAFMAPEYSAEQSQISIQAERIRKLEHDNKIQAQKIAELEEGNDDLANQAMASNHRTRIVKGLASFEHVPNGGLEPMDRVQLSARSCSWAMLCLEQWMREDTNLQDIQYQSPDLARILGHLHGDVGQLLDMVKVLMHDCSIVYDNAHDSDKEMVRRCKEMYTKLGEELKNSKVDSENSEVDRAIERKFPALYLE